MNENKLIRTIKNLEEQLTASEKQFCELQEKEVEYKREIFHLETHLFQTKQQNETFNKSFRKKLIRNTPGQTSQLMKPKVSADSLEDPEKEKLQKTLQEKEKEILNLKEKINETEIYYQAQLNSCMDQIKKLQNQGHMKFSIIGSEVLFYY